MHLKLLSGISESNHALALGGGGFNGSYTMRLLANLSDRYPTRINYLSGTSIGSYNAAILTEAQFTGKTFQEATKIGLDLWKQAAKHPPVGWDIFATFGFNGVLSTNSVRNFLKGFIPESRTLADYANQGLHLFIPATDLNLGQTVYFDQSMRVIDAMVVSGAFPIAFPSQKIPNSEHRFTDGGVMENMPLNPLIDAGADSIDAFFLSPQSEVLQPAPSTKSYTNAPDVLMRVIDVLTQKALAEDIMHAETVNELVVSLPEHESILADIKATGNEKLFARYIQARAVLLQKLDIKHLENKRILSLTKFFISKELPNLFDWSKKAYDIRVALADKDAEAYLRSMAR